MQVGVLTSPRSTLPAHGLPRQHLPHLGLGGIQGRQELARHLTVLEPQTKGLLQRMGVRARIVWGGAVGPRQGPGHRDAELRKQHTAHTASSQCCAATAHLDQLALRKV